VAMTIITAITIREATVKKAKKSTKAFNKRNTIFVTN
jgi:hypothetical protein